PVKRFNQAYLDGDELAYPVKTKKPRPKPVAYVAVLAKMQDQWLMTKRPSNGMLANLWTVPLIPIADLDLDDDYQPEELVTA
ncbi:hypothetical protein NL523_28815, partial [Klebsiella pneumoniae]|nr:hypothetical protein [Klebsiella pneumoniae]MCP6663751.1 hypothetical protein [Klebsiella pneumoniae]